MHYLYIAVTHNIKLYSILYTSIIYLHKTVLDITSAFLFHNEIAFTVSCERHGVALISRQCDL